ncbi:MAG: flavodoxin domain-containing protein [Parachlamydiaceae bacterium]
MAKVLIVYDTDYGNTQKMALSVAEGVKTVEGASVTVKKAEETTAEDLLGHDAIVFGSPVHMGSPSWRMKKFIDEVCSRLWMKDKLIGKVCGVFVSGAGYGSAGGGCEVTMLALLNNCAELGLLIVPLPKNTPGYKDGGLQWGPYGRSMGPNMEQVGVLPEGLIAAYHHGANIARAALTVTGKKIFN